jgi:hypothetical protein
MATPSLIAVVRRYLDLLEQGAADVSAVAALAELLDQLALACHAIGDAGPADAVVEAPRGDYDRFRRLAEQRFPGFGSYNDAPLRADIGAAELATADAIDDLADIACDLSEVRWLWENADAATAAWQYRFSYRTHFGRHLHGLRRYVHEMMFAA